MTTANYTISKSDVTITVGAIVIGFLNCVALVGNIFVCNAIVRNPRLRNNISNTFVFALALSDIAIASLCMPFSLCTTIIGKWIFGSFMCQLQGFSVLTFAMISLHTMGLISVNRYFCICRRSKYLHIFKKRRTIIFIIAIWFFSLFGSVPPFFLDIGGYAFQPGKSMCLYTFEANIPYTIFIEVVYIALPLLIITVCYRAVFKEVYRNNQVFVTAQENIDQLRANVREAKVSKTLAGVILAYVICWVPISIIDFIDVFNGMPTLPREVYQMYTILAFISSSVNPFIYGLVSRTFLHEYKKMLMEFASCKFLLCRQRSVDAFNSDFVSPDVNPAIIPVNQDDNNLIVRQEEIGTENQAQNNDQ